MQTKIVCTIGPASSSKTVLKRMIQNGMRIARINFSHGTHESNGKLLKNIRHTAIELGKDVGIMTDLQGPRIRVLSIEDQLEIKRNDLVYLFEGKETKPVSETDKVIGIDSNGLIQYLEKGDPVYIDQGMMELVVEKKINKGMLCKVVVGGIVKSRKGLNIPKISPRMDAFTKSDKMNLEFVLSQNIDYIAMSFVKTKDDILKLRKRIEKILKTPDKKDLPGIVAKIETREAVKNFDEILEVVDAVMIARGDLAIEQPMEEIPTLQKNMIKKCMEVAKPVIVATQMLESMMEYPRPTRAEITDVANAVIDHTDAVMLSGESAMGKFPVETVQMMSKIISYTENGSLNDLNFNSLKTNSTSKLAFFAKSAILLAQEMQVKNIVIQDCSIEMAYQVAQYRPELNIVFLTKDKRDSRKLVLLWGLSTRDHLGQVKGGYVLIDKVFEGSGRIVYSDNNKCD